MLERCQVPKIRNGLRMLGSGLTLRGRDMGDSSNPILLAGDCMRGRARPSAGAEALTETRGHNDAARGASCLRLGELGAHRFLRAAFWDWYRQAVGRSLRWSRFHGQSSPLRRQALVDSNWTGDR
jgi:hypothetical protein